MNARHTVVLCLALVLAGCATQTPAPPPEDGNRTPPGELPEAPPADPDTLMGLVFDQVHDADGEPRYRTPGTEGHRATIPILREMLAARGLAVEEQSFETEIDRLGRVELTNLYGVREGSEAGEVWLAAHWDSRAWADADPDPDNRDEPVLGANDGAAAVAVVVHALDLLPATNLTIKVALFDGEDQGHFSGWALGSKYAADQLTEEEIDRIVAFLLVDMPGDEDLEIRREGRSDDAAPALVDLVFATARRLGAERFIDERGPPIEDDHVAFLARGVPAVDLIHLDRDDRRGPFPWTHHTVHDTPEHLSPTNMAEVTDVVVATVLRVDGGALRTA